MAKTPGVQVFIQAPLNEDQFYESVEIYQSLRLANFSVVESLSWAMLNVKKLFTVQDATLISGSIPNRREITSARDTANIFAVDEKLRNGFNVRMQTKVKDIS